MQFEIRTVTISPSGIQDAIRTLEEAIQQNTRLKQLCEELLSIQGVQGKRPRGRPRKNAASALEPSTGTGRAAVGRKARGGRGGRPRAGQKTLKQYIEEVLVGQSEPVRPKDLVQEVIDAGYVTTGKRSSLYTSVFNTAKGSSIINKTKAGFSLKPGATPSADSDSGGGRLRKKRATRKKKRIGRPRKQKS